MNYKLYILPLLLLVVSCYDAPDLEPYAEQRDEQMVTLSIESFSNHSVGATRSAGDNNTIYRGYIFFYDASGAFKCFKTIGADLTILQSGATVRFDAGEGYSIKDKIIAVFNHDLSADLPSDFSAVTAENISSYFPISAEYLADVEQEMNNGGTSLGMPMYLNDFADTDRATREVYRSLARMELFIKKGIKIEHDSHKHEVEVGDLKFEVVNAASLGSVGVGSEQAYAVENCFDADSFDGSYTRSLTMLESVASDTNNKVYLQSFPYSTLAVDGSELSNDTFDKNRFAIIIKHSDEIVGSHTPDPRYYKLNLLDKKTSTYFDVEPNHSYRVIIKAINSRGYSTLEEALEMPPSNIEYEIYDDKGGLTTSNGQYAISMDDILSYDEVLVYGANETTIEFNNIRYVLPLDGQMSEADFITNEIIFDVQSNTSGLQYATASDFAFDGSGKSKLTADGKSIKLTLSGEGECTITLRIRLGNLEIGRDNIKIKKIATNGEGDGAFDAHPNHFELPGQLYVDGSWRSDDIDFGARPSSVDYDDCGDGGTVIYMGENTTPTGYRTMDGYVSGEHSINSYPVFSPKTRRGYYDYVDAKGETRKVMIQLDQLAPFYLGHFGNTASDDAQYHYNGLVCEKIEEIKTYVSGGSGPVKSENNGVLEWSEAHHTYYKGEIWGDFKGHDRYLNLVNGLEITRSIVEDNKSEPLPTAAHYCYMKNDVNGNGKIDANEPINWYLPAQNQVLAMWINKNVFDSDIDLYKLNNIPGRDSQPYYWTCSEMDGNVYDLASGTPANFDIYVMRFNVLEGQAVYHDKMPGSWSACHVRCVRGL